MADLRTAMDAENLDANLARVQQHLQAVVAERDRLRKALEAVRCLPSRVALVTNAEARAMYEIATRALGPDAERE